MRLFTVISSRSVFVILLAGGAYAAPMVMSRAILKRMVAVSMEVVGGWGMLSVRMEL